MLYFYLLIIFLLGLAVGSFLNCLIYRLPQHKRILGRSFCPKCGQKITWFDLIPILSFLKLKGRCRYCQQKISWQYPLVELATGILFAVAFLTLNYPVIYNNYFLLLLRSWFLITVLIFIFVYDLKYWLVEDKIVLPAALIIFIINFFSGYSFLNLALAGIIGIGFFTLQYLITQGKGIGAGDLRIGLFIGLGLGWPEILIALSISYLIGSLVALFFLISGRKKMTSRIPLGPFLSLGTIITLFYGEKILAIIAPFF